MNRQPETATDDPLLQPAVFTVLQSRSAGKVKFLQDCKELQTANGGFHLQESTKRAS